MDTNKTSEELNQDEATPENTASPEETTAEEAPAEETVAEVDEVAVLRAELAAANDKYLRMLAEYDNYRRRSQKEKQSVWQEAVAETVKELLPIADNLDRAAHADGDADAIRTGLDMTLTALTAMMTKLGLEFYGETGDLFDPNLHNAVMHVDDDTLGEGVITDVFQRGCRLGDKIIRFAMVKVAN